MDGAETGLEIIQDMDMNRNKDTESKKKMEESMTEIFNDMEDMVESVMKYADASEKPALKQKIVQMAQKVQSMN